MRFTEMGYREKVNLRNLTNPVCRIREISIMRKNANMNI